MAEKYYGVGDNINAIASAPILIASTVVLVVDTSKFETVDLPCLATIEDPNDPGPFERVIVRVVNAPDTMVIERGYGGDAIGIWPIESVITLRVMEQHVQDLYDNNIMQIQESAHAVEIPNIDGQVESIHIYENATLLVRLVECDFTYPDTETQLPSEIVRRVYKYPGTTVWRTETTTLTYLDGRPIILSRVIS